MKMTKCNKPAICDQCQKDINKGDLYRKKSKRIGSSKADTMEMREGIPTIIGHGITINIKICQPCAEINELQEVANNENR